MAKYPYIVKYNGVWYDAGEEVPETEDMAVDESSPPYSDDDIEFEERPQKKQYTKTDINKMTTADLQELAFDNGFEDAYEMTGGELKKELIEHFKL